MSKRNLIIVVIASTLFILLLVFGIFVVMGLDDEETISYDEFDATYVFTGTSEHFHFDFGRVYFSPTEQKISIRDFEQDSTIENLKSEKLTISFENEEWMSLENVRNLNQLNKKIDAFQFYEAGTLCSNDSGIQCEKTAFNLATESNFKDIIKIEMEYCTDDDFCSTELFHLEYDH